MLKVELTAAVEMLAIRPCASVVITGMAVALPVVTAPGPEAGKLIAVPEIVKVPAPVLVLMTRVPASYHAVAPNDLFEFH